jgi:general stress protein YciG
VATTDRGFASMDPEKQRAIASKGGKTAHLKGSAHEWTREEARAAGRKGGSAAHVRRRTASTTGNPLSGVAESMMAPEADREHEP